MAEEFDIGPVQFDKDSGFAFCDVKNVGRVFLKWDDTGGLWVEVAGVKSKPRKFADDFLSAELNVGEELGQKLGLDEESKININKAVLYLANRVKAEYPKFAKPDPSKYFDNNSF